MNTIQRNRINKARKEVLPRLFLFIALAFCSILVQAQNRVRKVEGVLPLDEVRHRIDQSRHDDKLPKDYRNTEVYYYDFTVPQAGIYPYLNVTARGGDGGKVTIYDILNHPVRTGKGGQGTTMKAVFKIGTGPGELKPNSTLRVIVGQSGRSDRNNWGAVGNLGAGGGGGTGVLYLPAGADETVPANWKILMVAGGGGGGNAGTKDLAIDGHPGQTTECGFIHHSFANNFSEVANDNDFLFLNSTDLYVPGLYNKIRNGGFFSACSGGGGGTSYQTWEQFSNGTVWTSENIRKPEIMGNSLLHSLDEISTSEGLFQPLNGNLLPIGGLSGEKTRITQLHPVNYGGYGCGSGGTVDMNSPGTHVPGGGGGGYSGGYPEPMFKIGIPADLGAGGGGSYFNPEFVLPGSGISVANGATDSPANGYVEYQRSPFRPVMRDLGFEYHKGTEASVLKAGAWNLLWQYDGNLVLYGPGYGYGAWTSHTDNKGADLYFQGDGNLVIYQSGNPVWASNTANEQHGGKGGRKLVLTPEGSLYITDQGGKVIWQGR